MKYEFTQDCLIGIDMIDEEHRKFFDYINAGLDALDEPEGTGIQMAKNLLKKLEDYAATHFEHEEEYMRKTNDAELFLQIKAHQAFRDRIMAMKEKPSLRKVDLEEMFSFMAKWLYSHILSTDTLIGRSHNHGRFAMTKEFITGIGFVDEEHKTLFDIIGKVYDIIENDLLYDKFDPIMDVLSELKDYTIQHFADEEAYMEKINYDMLPAQKRAHEAFVEKIGEVGVENESLIDENQNEYLQEIAAFLNEWLINHILRMDKKIPVVKEALTEE